MTEKAIATTTLIGALNAANTEQALMDLQDAMCIDPQKLHEAAELLASCGDRTAPEFTAALTDADVPADAIEAYLGALTRWQALIVENEQRAIREADARALHLRDRLGEEHPQTVAAVLDATKMRDTSLLVRVLLDCSIDRRTSVPRDKSWAVAPLRER